MGQYRVVYADGSESIIVADSQEAAERDTSANVNPDILVEEVEDEPEDEPEKKEVKK